MKISEKYLPLEQNWLLYKGLEILSNFINNHNSEIESSDTFDLLSRVYSQQDWINKINEFIPEKIVKKMVKEKIYRAKLDFDDDVPEIARTIWFNEYARKYFRDFMNKERLLNCSEISKFGNQEFGALYWVEDEELLNKIKEV